VKVTFGILQELHFDLIGLRVKLDLIDLEIIQLGKQLLARHCRPPSHFGVENLLPFLTASHLRTTPLFEDEVVDSPLYPPPPRIQLEAVVAYCLLRDRARRWPRRE
jgi:hypothetical protein